MKYKISIKDDSFEQIKKIYTDTSYLMKAAKESNPDNEDSYYGMDSGGWYDETNFQVLFGEFCSF